MELRVTISLEEADITTGSTDNKRRIRDYYEKFYANKLDNLIKMDKFVERNYLNH